MKASRDYKLLFSSPEPPFAVGMEMVDVTQQPALDDYLEKRTSWSEFSRATGFDRGWGRTSPAYQRILSWCRKEAIPVVALNAPPIVTRKLARNEPLTVEQRRLVPNYPEPPGGFEQFCAAMSGHQTRGSLRRYYEAQRAWDRHNPIHHDYHSKQWHRICHEELDPLLQSKNGVVVVVVPRQRRQRGMLMLLVRKVVVTIG